ncbi:hypothetical protein WDZ92_36020, partial [Nostoc sp. NIES-2111]
MTLTRRHVLNSAAAGVLALGTSSFLPRSPARAADGSSPKILRVVTRTIEVNGRAASVYGLEQPDGTQGLTLVEGD